jgi:hypothetical protein
MVFYTWCTWLTTIFKMDVIANYYNWSWSFMQHPLWILACLTVTGYTIGYDQDIVSGMNDMDVFKYGLVLFLELYSFLLTIPIKIALCGAMCIGKVVHNFVHG